MTGLPEREAAVLAVLEAAGGRVVGAALADHVAVTGEGVQHEDRVVARLVEPAPRLVFAAMHIVFGSRS